MNAVFKHKVLQKKPFVSEGVKDPIKLFQFGILGFLRN